MTLKVLGLYFAKKQPRVKTKSPKNFKETYLSVLNLNAPLKIRFIQTNQAPFVNK